MKNKELFEYLKVLLGTELDQFLNSDPEPKVIRINSLKTNVDFIIKRLKKWNVNYKNLLFNPTGLELINDKIPLSHTIDFFLGYFYYQGIASQLPALVLNPKPGEVVLDIAAAPGSKSTQLAALMENQGILVLNDLSLNRIQSLNVNAQRAGIINQIILNLPGERFGKLFPGFFDKILVDAPCTALGTLASSPEIESWWTHEKLEKLCTSQKHLLIAAFKALKVGGEMVYSTCSVAPEENEMLIEWLIDKYPVEVMETPMKGKHFFESSRKSYKNQYFERSISRAIRVYPHINKTEGFFIIKLRKTGDLESEKLIAKSTWLPTLVWDGPSLRNELINISEIWGIPAQVWIKYRFLLTRHRIWLLNDEIEHVPREKLHNAGLLLAEKRISGWKLTNQSAQFFNKKIANRRISLEENQMVQLFSDGTLDVPHLEYGYYVLEWNNQIIASIYCENDRIKIRLPHSFRLRL